MEVTHSLRPPAAGRTTGITTSAGTTSLSYDYEGRVTGITYPSSATNSFSYNVLDARVGKVDSAGTWSYKRDGAGVTDGVLSDGFATYTPGVSRHASSTTTFEGGDYLGTNRVETNASQTVSGTRVYDAFGNLESTTGTPQGPFGFVGQFGYQGEGDSGLQLLGARYYDPSTGRFLSRDPVKDGRNWYAYCESSPTTMRDPTGLRSFWEWLQTGCGIPELWRSLRDGVKEIDAHKYTNRVGPEGDAQVQEASGDASVDGEEARMKVIYNDRGWNGVKDGGMMLGIAIGLAYHTPLEGPEGSPLIVGSGEIVDGSEKVAGAAGAISDQAIDTGWSGGSK